jgi:hypothetical protein
MAVLDFQQGALPEMRQPEDLRIDPVTSASWGNLKIYFLQGQIEAGTNHCQA